MVVVDPAGETRPGELPASWRALAEEAEVLWYRAPSTGTESLLGRTQLRAALDAATEAHVVSAGPAADAALALVAAHIGEVRSLLLVDPETPEPGNPTHALTEDGFRAQWRALTALMQAHDVQVRYWYNTSGPRRAGAAAPLGGAEVARAATEQLHAVRRAA